MNNETFEDALCVDSSVDFFSYKPEVIKQAKGICDECPIKRICLEKALENEERFGVWGGASELELRVAQSVDINGEKKDYGRGFPTRCPWCGPHSTKFLEVVKKKRSGTEVTCTNCNLTWFTKKAINKKKRNF